MKVFVLASPRMEVGSEIREPEAGLRERKKRRTRETIARVALELFAERGFHETTIKQVADAADVSPRTVSAYFPSKEELVFSDQEPFFADLDRRLRERGEGESAADALRAWIVSVMGDQPAGELERSRCQRAIIDSDPALRTYERGLQERAEQLIGAAVAVDLGLPADALTPRMVGAATMAALDSIRRDMSLQTHGGIQQLVGFVDEALAFIGAGVRELAERRGT